MFMEKSGNLLFQAEPLFGIAHRSSVIEQVTLDIGGEIIPLKDNRSAQTPYDTLFSCLRGEF
jgi:hypothetical protein